MKKKTNNSVITGGDLEQAFGDGFWELPIDQRANMLIRKMMGQHVEKVSKEDARRREQGQDVHS